MISTILILSTSLIGCASKTKDTLPVIKNPGIDQPYPPLPSDQVTECRDPGIRVGQNAKSALVQNRTAFKVCRAKHKQLVVWYQQLRQSRAGGRIVSKPVPAKPSVFKLFGGKKKAP